MKAKRRNASIPSARPEPTTEAKSFRKAVFGELEGTPAVGLFELIRQLRTSRQPEADELAKLLAKRIVQVVATGDGETFRQLAKLTESPVAKPAYCEALAWRFEAEIYRDTNGEGRACVKRADVLAAIQTKTGCDERTAARALAWAGVGELYGWKAGRPKES